MRILLRLLVATPLLAHIAGTLSVYPHQLAYFNEVAGGPENGHKHLLHSNLDWGQDLPLVWEWMRRHGVQPKEVRLVSYGVLDQRGLMLGDSSGRFDDLRWEIVSSNKTFDPDSRQHGRSTNGPEFKIGYSMWLIPMD